MKEQPKTVYRSMQGKEVDMNKLMNQHELTVAVGNVKVNARGDELGPGGKIIRKNIENVTSATMVPDQNNVVTQSQPVVEQTIKSSKGVKDISGMDPGGNE